MTGTCKLDCPLPVYSGHDIHAESGENWLPVSGFPGYEVSDHGRVRSSKRSGAVRLRKAPVVGGYELLQLHHSGRRVHRYVHRLVLEAFVGPCPDGMECCHNNGVRTDNRLQNLRWGTPLENAADRARHGTLLRGSANPHARLSDGDVAAIRASDEPQAVLARRYGISQPHVSNIQRGKRWRTEAA